MASTLHYNFPLMESHSKPSWLTDWNSTVSKIDTKLYELAVTNPNSEEFLERITDIEEDIQALSTTVEQNTDDIIDLNSSLTTIQESVTSITSSVATLNGAVETMQGEIGDLDDRVTDLEETPSYVLPIASSNDLGGIKVGNGLSIDANGELSNDNPTPYTLPIAGQSQLGGVKVGSGLAIDGNGVLSYNGSQYVLPPATANVLGGIKVGQGLAVEQDGTLNVNGGSSGGDVNDAFMLKNLMTTPKAIYSNKADWFYAGEGYSLDFPTTLTLSFNSYFNGATQVILLDNVTSQGNSNANVYSFLGYSGPDEHSYGMPTRVLNWSNSVDYSQYRDKSDSDYTPMYDSAWCLRPYFTGAKQNGIYTSTYNSCYVKLNLDDKFYLIVHLTMYNYGNPGGSKDQKLLEANVVDMVPFVPDHSEAIYIPNLYDSKIDLTNIRIDNTSDTTFIIDSTPPARAFNYDSLHEYFNITLTGAPPIIEHYNKRIS